MSEALFVKEYNYEDLSVGSLEVARAQFEM